MVALAKLKGFIPADIRHRSKNLESEGSQIENKYKDESKSDKASTETSMDRLKRIMEEAEKYDLEAQVDQSTVPLNNKIAPTTLSEPTKNIPKTKKVNVKRLQSKMSLLDMRSDGGDNIVTMVTPTSTESQNHNGSSIITHELEVESLSRTNSETLTVGDLILENFPSYSDSKSKDSSTPLPISRIGTDSSLYSGSKVRIANSSSKKEHMHSTSSLKFNNTKVKPTSATASKQTTSSSSTLKGDKSYISDTLPKARAINRQRSRTLDTSDLKRSSYKIIPSIPRFGASKPPPVTGKTRSKGIRKFSSSTPDDKNNNNSGRRKSSFNVPLMRKTRSNSGSSNSNKSSVYTSPRTSSGSFTSSDLPTHSQHTVTNNTTAASSSYSLTRRSSSIVNALSGFVNIRSSSTSSGKGIQASPQLHQHTLSLDDLPPVPEPVSEDEPFETYLFRISNYGKFIGIILTLKNDEYKLKCLNYFLSNYFEFLDDPLDISLRKLLIFLELPKEAQQIDRLLTEFGKIYYKQQKEKFMDQCMWTSEHQVYFIIFSLLMLHTDYFNPHNKIKMTKTEFIDLVHNDTYSDGNKMPLEILAYYYDNIVSKESPKFDCLLNQDTSAISSSFDTHENTEVYSPKNLIKNKTLFEASPKFNPNGMNKLDDSNIPSVTLPLPPPAIIGSTLANSTTSNSAPNTATTTSGGSTSFFGNRPTSNSISSYFSHSNSGGGSNSGRSTGNNTYFQDDINIYNKILSDNLQSASLEPIVDKIYCKQEYDIDNEVFQLINSNVTTGNNQFFHEKKKYDKYLNLLDESRGGYLRIPSSSHLQKLRLPSNDIFHRDVSDPCYYLKIITMGDIQDHTDVVSTGTDNSGSNRLFSLGKDDARDKNWKDKFAIMTTCGLILCDKKRSFQKQEPDIVQNKTNGETNYIIEFKSSKCEIISIYNLYAEKIKCNEDDKENTDDVSHSDDVDVDDNWLDGGNNEEDIINGYADADIKRINDIEINNNTGDDDNPNGDTFENSLCIWSQYGKFIWKCEDEYERDNWVNALNLMSCLDGCINKISCISNTVISSMTQTFNTRYKEVQENKLETMRLLKHEEKIINLYRQCIPICHRTKNEMIQNIKQLAVKMEWYNFEIKRDTIYMMILKFMEGGIDHDNPLALLQQDKEIKEDLSSDDRAKEDNSDEESNVSDSLSFITFD